MRILRFTLCLLIATLTTLPCLAQKQPLPTNVIPDGLGYNIHFTDAKPGELEMMNESGATIIRMDFGWGSTERQKGVYDFSAFERLTDSLEKQNIRPLYILDYSNRHYDEGLSPYSPEGRAAFAKWAAAAATHFKDRGIIWEMYNEPNISFWKPEPKPDDYILLALEVGKALREAAPNETYIGPATSQIDFEFLEKCFKAGLLEYWDAVSVHPYRQQPPETVIPEYAKLRWMIDKYAPEGKHIPILSAEWGYSSAWGSYNDDIQGKMLPRQWMVNLACDIPISIWYDWHDDGTDPKEPEHHFGTTNFEYHKDRTPVYAPKPSYIAAKTFTETFKGFKFNKRLAVGNDNNYVFLFENDKEVKLAVWTTEKEPQHIAIPCSPGTFKAISYLGEKQSNLIADDKGLSVAVLDGPIYLTPEKPNDVLSKMAQAKSYPMIVYHGSRKKNKSGNTDPGLEFKTRTPNPIISINSQDIDSFALQQKTTNYSASPLIISTPMMEGTDLVVQVDNPSGEEFNGMLELIAESGIEPDRLIQTFSLKDGEKRTIVRFRIFVFDFSVPLRWSAMVSEVNDQYRTKLQTVHAIDDFSKYNTDTLAANWGLFPDGDAEVDSEQTLAPGDDGALKVTYKFGDGWKFLRLAPKNDALAKIDGKPQSLTVRINADGSGNSIRLRFRDSKGQTFQVDGDKMSEKGMQYFTFDMTGKKSICWGGPKDGVVHYPIVFDSIIIDSTRKAFGPSEIEVFAPVLVYEE